MKIEAGKRYVRRDGKITGPIGVEGEGGDTDYPFYDDVFECTYTSHGVWKLNGEEHPQDLVMIYPEQPSQEAVEIKVLRAEVAALKVECERLNEVLKLVVPNVNDVVKAVAAAQAVLILKKLATQDELERLAERAESFAWKCWQQRNN